MSIRKDQSLDELAELGNVAQFISFLPLREGLKQQYSRISGFIPNHKFSSTPLALSTLLEASPERSINLRSYTPDSPRSREFVYGVTDIGEAVATVNRLAGEGMFVIANETVDINDGGVSGVAQGDIIEFAPDDTPRCVEKPGVVSLPRGLGIAVLQKVYGFKPEIPNTDAGRVEFSIHPKPRGWKKTHTLTWEYESVDALPRNPSMSWPNRFSRHIGDKAFGLLIADSIGVDVPKTTVIGRRVAPFTFGKQTGSSEVWTRTAPTEPEPGLFTTVKGWVDPFKLLATEDPSGTSLMSVLSQAAVPAKHSGAALVMADGQLLVEGHEGEGDALMLGKEVPEALPKRVSNDVEQVYIRLKDALGPVRFEWVHDGQRAWIVQLHCGQTQTLHEVIFPGEANRWVTFDVNRGIEALRLLLSDLPMGAGLTLVGELGLTSHVADLARKAKRPTRVVKQLSFAWGELEN